MTQLIFLVIKAAVIFFFCVGLAAMLIWGERKFAGFMQSRVGPNYAGPGGVLQTFGDLAKLLRKEDITPDTVDKPVFKIAPVHPLGAGGRHHGPHPLRAAWTSRSSPGARTW